MTNWIPQLERSGLPLYREIANALAGDIAGGRLAPGDQLPTHRDLAWQLKVTVGTVSRAYAEAERRGLIGGTVGRGTFVLPDAARPSPRIAAPPGEFIDLSLNYAIVGSESRLLAETLAEFAAGPDLGRLLLYQAHAGSPADRAAGAAWCRRDGLMEANPDGIVVTNGGQHGLAILLASLTRPGDAVAVEQLTYPGFKAAAQQSGVQLVGVAMDEHGLRPDALDAACRARSIRLLYTMPTLHNPTTVTMPEARRREIASICERHDVPVIEDDVYGFLRRTPLPPLVSFLPERGFYLTSLSKGLVPGLRVGYLHAPSRAIDRIEASIRASTYMIAPLMAAIGTSWIENGTAERLAHDKRRIAAERQPIVAAVFSDGRLGAELTAEPGSWHCWLTFPAGQRADEFAVAARQNGVGVTPAAAFAAGAAPVPEAVRFCLGTPDSAETLERGLQLLAETLADNRNPYLSVV